MIIGWCARDVVAHLNSANGFWQFSVASGLAGTPTQFLVGFDPNATPAMMVGALGDPNPAGVLAEFVTTNEALIAELEPLTDAQWAMSCETPVGHPAVRVLAHHALWDCWIHERDVILPLGIEPVEEPDEVRACLRFAAAIGPALALGLGTAVPGVYAVEASDPAVRFVVEVGDTVSVRDGSLDEASCLRGKAAELIEALSVRRPLPADAPPEWRELLGHGLTAAFS